MKEGKKSIKRVRIDKEGRDTELNSASICEQALVPIHQTLSIHSFLKLLVPALERGEGKSARSGDASLASVLMAADVSRAMMLALTAVTGCRDLADREHAMEARMEHKEETGAGPALQDMKAAKDQRKCRRF